MTSPQARATDSAPPLMLVAHRGYARCYPENTLESIEAALALGACAVEFDVQLTADLAPVLLHDLDLFRTSGVSGPVTDKTLAELTAIDVSETQRLGVRFAGVRIPRLATVAELLARRPRVEAFVEAKRESLERFGLERTISRVLDALGPASPQCTLISYEAECIPIARHLGAPRVGWVLADWSDETREQATALEPDVLVCNHQHLPAAAEQLWPGPWRWMLYEIDSAKLALDLAARGARLIETMAIGELLRHPLLAQRTCLE